MGRGRRLSWVAVAMLAALLFPAPASAGATCGGRNATILGSEGADRLEGTVEGDVIVALGGDDHVLGLRGADVVCGGAGRDSIHSGRGADFLMGDDGDDVLVGGGANDRVLGGRGDDNFVGQRGEDRLEGGAGTDTAGYFDERIPGGVTVDLTTGASGGSHGVDILDSIENVDGSPGHDVLIGDAGPNRLRAFARFDRLDGREGGDVLRGGGSDDRLDGGPGIDDCTGESLHRCEP